MAAGRVNGGQLGGLPAELPVTFTVDAVDYVIPTQPTRGMIDGFTQGNPLAVVPGLVEPDGADALAARLFDPADDLDLADIEIVALDVAESLAGVGYWPAARLLTSAVGGWLLFDGWCLQQGGFSPLEAPFPRVVAAAYAWRLAMCSKESEIAKLDAAVWEPVTQSITGRHQALNRPEWSTDREAQAWQAAFSRFSGGR